MLKLRGLDHDPTDHGLMTDSTRQCGAPELSFLMTCEPAGGVGIVNGDPTLERIAEGNGLALCAAGSWTARFAAELEQLVADAEKLGGSRPNIFIDVSQVSKLATFGRWL